MCEVARSALCKHVALSPGPRYERKANAQERCFTCMQSPALLCGAPVSYCSCWVSQVLTDLPDDILGRIILSLASEIARGALDLNDEHQDFRLSNLWRKSTCSFGEWLGPVKLTCRCLRSAVDLVVTKLLVNTASTTTDQLGMQLKVCCLQSLLAGPVRPSTMHCFRVPASPPCWHVTALSCTHLHPLHCPTHSISPPPSPVPCFTSWHTPLTSSLACALHCAPARLQMQEKTMLLPLHARDPPLALQVFPHLEHIRLAVVDASSGDNLAVLTSVAPLVKELALVSCRGFQIRHAAECPPALLDALPSMTALETLWWSKTPSGPELQAMQGLSNLQNLELDDLKPSTDEPSCFDGLAGLTGLTLLAATFQATSNIMPVLQLTRLGKLRVVGGLASPALLLKILTGFPYLREAFWCTLYSDDPDHTVPPVMPGTSATSLTRLTSSSLDGHACSCLQSLSFPLLQDLQVTARLACCGQAANSGADSGLAWFPRMGRSVPSLTSLDLQPPAAYHPDRVSNLRAGIPLLTSLTRLHLKVVACCGAAPERRSFVGAEWLAGLTRLTRLYADGVVDPRCFDREVAALANLKALRELELFEGEFHLEGAYIPSPDDCVITREAVCELRASLPNLERFQPRGGWQDVRCPGWVRSRVTPQGLIVSRDWASRLAELAVHSEDV